jgi:polyisoprenyl-phosphate glycosyltransferase
MDSTASGSTGNPGKITVSVVVPVYYNAPTLVELYERLGASMNKANADWEVTFVDDNSGDSSREVLATLYREKSNVRLVFLSRNFGSFDAISAGLCHASGDCTVVISADLQDPPELLTEMIASWREGVKVVLATRQSREDPWSSRVFSFLYYRLFRLLVSREMPPGGFDFMVLDRQGATLLTEHAEKNAMLPAALLYYGFKRKLFSYHREARRHGISMWTFWRKVKLMYDAILSNSYVPIRIVTAVGALAALISGVYGLIVVIQRLLNPTIPAGWTALMVVLLFFHGIGLVSIGILGEYVWRAFDAARKRPQFVVDTVLSPRGAQDDG